MTEEKENIVKKTCKELGLTYRQLGELIGFGEEAISKAARTENISTQMQKALDLYLENIDLKEKLKVLDTLSDIIKQLSK
ncbi:transcriptional regulator [Campylobacter jejuni]|nr:transcriptional regulator [Campylobacter coli]EAJ2034255.1 transcriptional regulator [Campylobacter jejuni]EAI6874352.1 transcriptional regulator [Campylobacter coli]EAI8472610.1 transcriptional regulator [Campylobacter coli]EAK4607997.1 transcriptional regulator [Campylobacter coli]